MDDDSDFSHELGKHAYCSRVHIDIMTFDCGKVTLFSKIGNLTPAYTGM